MTLIIALRDRTRIYLAGERLGSSSQHRVKLRDPKVFQVGPAYIGGCGSFRMLQVLEFELHLPEYRFENETPRNYMVKQFIPVVRATFEKHGILRRADAEDDKGGNFLVILGGEVFDVQEDFSVLRSDKPYEAIGSGEDFAKASLMSTEGLGLEPRGRLKLAFDAAAEFSTGVGREFDVLEIELRSERKRRKGTKED